MSFIPKRPPSLKHISEDAAARALSRHFGDFVKAARDLNVKRTDLRKLSWHNPKILDASHERMEMFVWRMRDEIISGLNSKVASVRRRAIDRMVAHPEMFDNPFAGGLSLFAPAARARGPHRLAEDGEKAARLALEREAEAELAREREREAAVELEQEAADERERVEVMVEIRPSAPAPVPTASLWPAWIRRPTRGRRWR